MSEHIPNPPPDLVPDLQRTERLGFDEAVYCYGKTADQIGSIIDFLAGEARRGLLTRLSPEKYAALSAAQREPLDYDELSQTAVLGAVLSPTTATPRVTVVTAGTSDVPVAKEAVRTLNYYGEPVQEIYDVGVAGLWRLLNRVDDLRQTDILIAAAGMDAALPSVLGGLVPGLVIAVPTSTGYGVAATGESALNACLASCAPGVVVVNIDNGYGAACAALRMCGALERRAPTATT